MKSIRRHDVVFFALAAILVGLGMFHAQAIHQHENPSTDEQKSLSEKIDRIGRGQKMVQTLPGRPGKIFARSRHSHVLAASSRQVPSCFIDPSLLQEAEFGEICFRLARILDMDAGRLYQEILQRRERRFAWVARRITEEQMQSVRELDHKAVGIQYEWQREYPNGSLAGTVLGARRQDGQPVGAIELSADQLITPRDGKRTVLGDARRRAIWDVPDQSVRATDGRNIYLSIDLNLQKVLVQSVSESVEKYGAEWGTGVLINPWTGDILAMCSVPTYDPNHYNTASPESMLNRVISCPVEPGSVLKPIFAAAAVQSGVVNWGTKIFCENGVYFAHRGGRIGDHGHRYGFLSLIDIIVKSSNIGMAKIGEMLGNARLHQIAQDWGFSRKTGIPLGGETSGILRPVARWDGYSTRRIPFGQEISISSLQLAMAFGAIANGGLLMQPRLVHRIASPEGEELWRSKPRVVRRVLSPSVARASLDVLGEVVSRGTGKKCRLSSWNAFGKTGTAQVPGPQGYIDGAYVGSFVGGAPVEKPAVVCLISIYRPDRHKGYYGGTVAAPFVREVLEKALRYLQVPPNGSARIVSASVR